MMGIQLQGVGAMHTNIDLAEGKTLDDVKLALEAVVIEAVNDAKRDRGGFDDQTGNLRASIRYVKPYFGKEGDVIQRVGSGDLGGEDQQEILDAPSGGSKKHITTIIYAGMEYAVYVEFKPGHWVLGPTWNDLVATIERKLSSYLRGMD